MRIGEESVRDQPRDRVLLVGAGELFGGVERHLLDLMGALAQRGVDARLALFHDAELAAQVRAQGFQPILLPEGKWEALASASALARAVTEMRADVVHAHGYKAIFACALARRHHSFAVVKTEHGLPETPSGWGGRAIRSRLYARLDAAATRATQATVCYVTDELRTHFVAKHAGLNSRVVSNGVASASDEPLQCPPELHGDRVNLAIVGRLEPVKGHAIVIEALALPALAKVQLHIVGTGPCEGALRELVAARGLQDRVHFKGFRRDARAYMAYCHALLMPSLHEGLPYTLLEAMALGTPVIASRVGGIAEITEDGLTALLVPPADPRAFAAAIERLLGDAALRAQLAANARSLQLSRFSLDGMAARYLDIYRQLSEQSPVAGRFRTRGRSHS